MRSKEFSYIGVGRVYLGPTDGSGKLRPIGNVSELNFQPQEETQELRNFQDPGGGLANSMSRINSVNMTLAMRDFIAANIAVAMRGDVDDVEGGSVSDEEHTAFKGGLIRLDHIDPSSVEVTDEGGSTTYEAGSDYEVTAAGIFILEDGDIDDEETVEVSYEHDAQKVVETLVQSGEEFLMVFDGVNEAQSGKPVVIDAWRVRFSPTENMNAISDEFGTLQVTGRLLADPNKGADLSAFMRVTQIED